MLVIEPTQVGIVPNKSTIEHTCTYPLNAFLPVKQLAPRLKYVTCIQLQKYEGIVPRYSIDRNQNKIQTQFKYVPDKLFELKYKLAVLVSKLNDEGIVPIIQ